MGKVLRFRKKRRPPPRVKCKFCRYSLAKGKNAMEKMLFHVQTEHKDEWKKMGGRLRREPQMDTEVFMVVAEFQSDQDRAAFISKERGGVRVIRGDKK